MWVIFFQKLIIEFREYFQDKLYLIFLIIYRDCKYNDNMTNIKLIKKIYLLNHILIKSIS